jgi:hypothetical protein
MVSGACCCFKPPDLFTELPDASRFDCCCCWLPPSTFPPSSIFLCTVCAPITAALFAVWVEKMLLHAIDLEEFKMYCNKKSFEDADLDYEEFWLESFVFFSLLCCENAAGGGVFRSSNGK